MIQKFSAWKRRKAATADESGFTLIEIVIAIPIVFLVLGLVLSSAGVTLGLMAQVTKSSGAARTATAIVDELDSARSCAEVSYIIGSHSTVAPEAKYAVDFGQYTCQERLPFTLKIDVRESEGTRVYFSKSITLAAM